MKVRVIKDKEYFIIQTKMNFFNKWTSHSGYYRDKYNAINEAKTLLENYEKEQELKKEKYDKVVWKS